MTPVFFGKDGLFEGYSPINTERWIHYGDASVSFGMVVVVAFILKYGDVAEDSKAMSEASRDKELAVVVFCQFYSYMLAICRGTFTYIDGYIKDRAFYTAYELCMGEGRPLEVKATHNTICRAGFVVLDEVYFGYFFFEFLLVVAFEEVASGILEDSGLDDYYSFYICLDYIHIIMLHYYH